MARTINFTDKQSPVIPFEINGKTYHIEYGSTRFNKVFDRYRDTDLTGKSLDEQMSAFDEIIDGLFGAGSAAEIFEDYPDNVYVRLLVISELFDGVAESPQAKAQERVLRQYSARTISDGAADRPATDD